MIDGSSVVTFFSLSSLDNVQKREEGEDVLLKLNYYISVLSEGVIQLYCSYINTLHIARHYILYSKGKLPFLYHMTKNCLQKQVFLLRDSKNEEKKELPLGLH